MTEAAKRKAVYEDLFSIPEEMTAEIISGELVITPRPSRKHTSASSSLGFLIGPAYQLGRGGPGGWVIILEPEIGLEGDILVPDLAGWKMERYPGDEPHNWISVVPDWVCEVISPNTLKRDRMLKMSIYAQNGVPYSWLIDPTMKTLDVFRLEGGEWVVAGLYAEDAAVRAEPFSEITINLSDIWR